MASYSCAPGRLRIRPFLPLCRHWRSFCHRSGVRFPESAADAAFEHFLLSDRPSALHSHSSTPIWRSRRRVFCRSRYSLLLWTLISLITNVEDVFNLIWGIKQGRSLWRKITDYTAIVLILPILMICASGIMVFMSSTLTSLFPAGFFSPLLKVLFDLLSLVMTWLFLQAAIC